MASKLYRRRTTDNETTLKELMAREPDPADQKPVIYDAADDTYKTTDELSIDSAKFDTLTANKAYVQELHAVQEQQEVATSDYLVLRANNESSLTSGSYSGVIVNNYDGEKALGIVADSNGTARVGTGSKTDTTYEDLYYSNGKYYTDETLETEVAPEGELTAWSSIEETEDYTHYTAAVFSVIDLSDTQPILTRAEESELNDQGILKYNTESHKADTIPVPNKSEQFLTSTVTEGTPEATDYAASINGATYDAELNEIDISEYEAKPVTAEFEHSGEWYELDNRYYYYNDTWYELTGLDMTELTVTTEEVTVQRILDDLAGHETDGNLRLLRIEYITAPATAGTVSYTWTDKLAGNYHFATMAEYEAAMDDIPEGSLVMIDEETTYVVGDDQ